MEKEKMEENEIRVLYYIGRSPQRNSDFESEMRNFLKDNGFNDVEFICADDSFCIDRTIDFTYLMPQRHEFEEKISEFIEEKFRYGFSGSGSDGYFRDLDFHDPKQNEDRMRLEIGISVDLENTIAELRKIRGEAKYLSEHDKVDFYFVEDLRELAAEIREKTIKIMEIIR